MNTTDYVYGLAATAQVAAATSNLTVAFATTAGTTYTHGVPSPDVPLNGYAWFKGITSPF